MTSLRKKPLALVVTPALLGGSWVAVGELMKEATKELDFMVVGYGREFKREQGIWYRTIPFWRYDKYGRFVNSHPLLNLLYSIPLILLGFFFVIIYRPCILVANGLLASLPGVLTRHYIRTKILISYHGDITYYTGRKMQRLIRFFIGKHIDFVQVNSEGSWRDAVLIFDPAKVAVIKHWADESFFASLDREKIREKLGFSGKFVILFVGRIDAEKHCDALLDVAARLRENPEIVFQFVGDGEMTVEVKKVANKKGNVRYQSYLYKRETLREYYVAADLLWGYADESYLARPSIEGLACGTPLLVPSIPAVLKKAKQNIIISKELVPEEIGWLVDIKGCIGKYSDTVKNPDAAAKLILQIKSLPETTKYPRRLKCTAYARKHHSIANLREKKRHLLHLINC